MNGMATAADWMSAASFHSMAGLISNMGYGGIYVGMGIVFAYAVFGGMNGITYTQVAQYIVLILPYTIPAVFISLLRRVWRILVKRDFSEVALKRGVSPDNPEKFAPYEMLVNLVAGVVTVVDIVAVLLGHLDDATWTAIAGSTTWCKFFASFALSRHAHASWARKT